MGCAVQNIRLGQTTGKTATSVAAGGLLTAANLAPEPMTKAFLYAAAGVASVISQLFKFGYDPKKLNDTAVTEAFRIAFNKAWEELTGERLPYSCDPGQCGKQKQAIFAGSAWPNVPYPAGKPGTDPAVLAAAIEQMAAEGRAALQRPESVAGYEGNLSYARALVQKVQQHRAEQSALERAAGYLPRTEAGAVDFGALLPWAAGGLVLYKLLT
jgi:hypothetical protein